MHVASSFTFFKKDRIGVTNTSRSLINSCYQFITTRKLLLPSTTTTKSTMKKTKQTSVQPLDADDADLADSMSDRESFGASEGDCPLHHAEQAQTNTNISGDGSGVLIYIYAYG